MSISSPEQKSTVKTEKVKAVDTREVKAIMSGLDEALDNAGLGSLEGLIAETKEGVQDDYKAKSSGGKKTKGSKQQDYSAWRASLISAKPSQSDMISDIQKSLKFKLESLVTKQNKLEKKSLKTVSEYNNVVAQIRNVNNMLDRVAHAGYAALKALWLKIVHGIM